MSQAVPDPVSPAREGETLSRLLVEQMPALLWSTDRDLKLTSRMGGLAHLVPDANRAVGLTLFIIGLSKKVLIADRLAQFATPVFGAAAEPLRTPVAPS